LRAVSKSCSQVFRNGLTYVHDRDASSHQIDDALRSVCWKVRLCNAPSRWIKGFSGLEHGVHDNCELVSNSHGRAFEAKPFTQLEAPGPELTIDTWHDVIGEPTFADAILDRLVHNSYRIELDGQSMRKTKLETGDGSTQN